MRKLTCPPNSETLGTILSSFSDNLQGSDTYPVMEKHNMVNLDPMGWYPVQRLLDALNELAERSNLSSSLVAIGMKIGETVPIPPEIPDPTVEQVLMIWDELYQGLHRGADLGCVQIEKIADNHFKTIHTNPYPDDMSYGILYTFGRRFLPPGTQFTVYYDNDFPGRDYGGTTGETTIHIQWD